MLLKRIIPCLDVDKGRVVKGVKYVDHVDAGDPVEVAQLYDAQEADEITFLDISASHEGRGVLLDAVTRTAETVFMPLTVGGGVRSLDDIRDLLNAGADKVSIMTAAVANPDLVGEAAVRVRVDARHGTGSRAFGLHGDMTGEGRLTGPALLGREGHYPHLPKLLPGVTHRTDRAATAPRTHFSGFVFKAARSIEIQRRVNWIGSLPQQRQNYPEIVKTDLTGK